MKKLLNVIKKIICVFGGIILLLIIQISIVIMHFHRIGMVKILDFFHRDSLTKISFKAIHAHIQQRL